MLRLTLMIALLGSTAFADGEMGNGNTCPPEGCAPPPCTVNCGAANQSDETGQGSVSTGDSLENFVIDYVEQTFVLFTF